MNISSSYFFLPPLCRPLSSAPPHLPCPPPAWGNLPYPASHTHAYVHTCTYAPLAQREQPNLFLICKNITKDEPKCVQHLLLGLPTSPFRALAFLGRHLSRITAWLAPILYPALCSNITSESPSQTTHPHPEAFYPFSLLCIIYRIWHYIAYFFIFLLSVSTRLQVLQTWQRRGGDFVLFTIAYPKFSTMLICNSCSVYVC